MRPLTDHEAWRAERERISTEHARAVRRDVIWIGVPLLLFAVVVGVVIFLWLSHA